MTHAPQRALARITALATAALLAAGGAHAVVGTPGTTGLGGSMADIGYGNGGNIFELEPMLHMLLMGDAGNPQTVVNRNAALQFSVSVSGADTDLMTIDYRIRNNSASESFNQLRFMVYANPDGAPDLMDTLSEAWGPAVGGGPVLREGRAYVNPVVGIKPGFGLNNNLSEGLQPLDAACTGGAGCDATVGLQWNAALLAPGETFHVRLGLSDNGKSLSGRFLQAAAVSDPDTVLTLSGTGLVTAVPEPSAVWMLLAGMGMLGSLARRRRLG